jgi:hypothetical protein
MTVTCPHCGTANAAASQFCLSCGQALPSQYQAGPRVVDGTQFATTAAGQKLQGAELHKQAKKAAGALLAVSIIFSAVFAFTCWTLYDKHVLDLALRTPQFLAVAAMVLVFWVLYFWARVQPLPAAIVGLVLYGTLIVINVARVMSSMNETGGHPGGGGIGGFGVGFVDILIMVVLAQAITAGSKYRKLQQQQQY